jgi:hypothetical protein
MIDHRQIINFKFAVLTFCKTVRIIISSILLSYVIILYDIYD